MTTAQNNQRQNAAGFRPARKIRRLNKLYSLTEEEIKIVEGDSSAKNTSELVKNRLGKVGSV
jgi:hypothetical protein